MKNPKYRKAQRVIMLDRKDCAPSEHRGKTGTIKNISLFDSKQSDRSHWEQEYIVVFDGEEGECSVNESCLDATQTEPKGR